jgi:hypothetical protein
MDGKGAWVMATSEKGDMEMVHVRPSIAVGECAVTQCPECEH